MSALCPVAVFTTIIFLCTGAGALAQRPSQSYDNAAVMQQICRQYAAAVTGMPADLMLLSDPVPTSLRTGSACAARRRLRF
jgi:hypothetical protein